MRARTSLAILLVVALASAGCLGTAGQGTPTDSPTATPTAPPSESPAAEPTFEDATFADGPKEAPDRPDELTESTVSEYARTFEYRRAYNSLWMGEGTDVNLDCETHDVEAVDGGYDVLVSCTGYANSGGEQSTSTATVHADWFTQHFVYRITEDGDERRRATEEERSSNSL